MEDKFLSKFIKKYNIEDTDKTRKILSKLYHYDPSPNKKYLHWLYKLFIIEDVDLKYFDDVLFNDINQSLLKLENYPDRFKNVGFSIDIYSYKTFEEFLFASEKAYQRANKRVILKNDIDLVDEFNGIVILYPSTYQASCFYGKGTRWCITDSSTYDDYMSKGNLFFILNKESNREDYKTALFIDFFYKVEGYNSEDSVMTVKFDDINEIDYIRYTNTIIYPNRVASSIKKYIKNIQTFKPGELYAKVFNAWVKTLGGDYLPEVADLDENEFYLLKKDRNRKSKVGEYKVLNEKTLKDFISEIDVDDILYDTNKIKSLCKAISEKELLKYFYLDLVFEEILKDDSKFRFYDEYNIEDIDYYDGLRLTPELKELKSEFMKNPVKFYNDNIFVNTTSTKPKYGVYYNIEGMLFYYSDFIDTEKLLNDYTLEIIDAKSQSIIFNYENEKYYIINKLDSNLDLYE